MTYLAEFAIVTAITWLAFWQKNVFLYIIATIPLMVYGLQIAASEDVYSTLWVAGIIVAIIGLFCLFRAVNEGILPMFKRGK